MFISTIQKWAIIAVAVTAIVGGASAVVWWQVKKIDKLIAENAVLEETARSNAAAVEQLKLWGERIDCHVIASKMGADPSAVVYDAIESSLARGSDILIVDTAGRQHTKKGLMEELAKMKRTAEKILPGSPHEVWLTIDAGIGTNALQQTQEFTNYGGVTGLVLTKLDGTGKGGMAVAIQGKYESPVFYAGFGEQPEDLQPFDPEMFTEAIFGKSE